MPAVIYWLFDGLSAINWNSTKKLQLIFIVFFMIENVPSFRLDNKLQLTSNDYKLDQRQGSQKSHNSSSNKFLKRKPDHKKILLGPSSKKKRESSMSQYFAINTQSDGNQDSEMISGSRFHTSRFITNKHDSIEDSKISQNNESLMLETAKSQNNIFARRNEIGLITNRNNEERNKISKDYYFLKDSQQSIKSFNRVQSRVDNMHISNIINPHHRNNSKKSKTQFFNFEQLKGLSDQNSDIFNKLDANELNSTRQCGDLSQQYQKLKGQYETLTKKSKLLQEQIQLFTERNYLLSTQKKHLQEILKEKDKIIDRMQRQKSLFKLKGRSEIDKEVEKHKDQIKLIKNKLSKEQEKNRMHQEDLSNIQNDLNIKNEELIMVYDQYTELQSKYRKQQQQMANRLQKMKQEVEKIRQQHQEKPNVFQFNPLNQAEKWRQKLLKQQSEIKYLQIQNQCLLISKDQLCKSESENRKLRDQRDYFKKKIMENIKRNKRSVKDFSRSDNSSILLELSDLSIEHRE